MRSYVTKELVEPYSQKGGQANERKYSVCDLRLGNEWARNPLGQMSQPSQKAASAYREGHAGGSLEQGESLAMAAHPFVERQSNSRKASD